MRLHLREPPGPCQTGREAVNRARRDGENAAKRGYG